MVWEHYVGVLSLSRPRQRCILTSCTRRIALFKNSFRNPIQPGILFYFIFLFSIPLIIFALLSSLPPSRNSDPGSHSRLLSPPTHYGSCRALNREKISDLSSLVDLRRMVIVHNNEERGRSEPFFPWFSKEKKTPHNGLYERRVPKIKNKTFFGTRDVCACFCVFVCLCDCVFV